MDLAFGELIKGAEGAKSSEANNDLMGLDGLCFVLLFTLK